MKSRVLTRDIIMLALGVVAFGFIGACGVFGIIACLSRGHDEPLFVTSLAGAAIGLPVAILFAGGLSRAVNRKRSESMIINESFPPRPCPNCQREVAPNVEFCPMCGAALSEKPKPSSLAVIIIFLFVPAAVFGSCAISFLGEWRAHNYHDELGIGTGLMIINALCCLGCLIAGIVMLKKRSRK